MSATLAVLALVLVPAAIGQSVSMEVVTPASVSYAGVYDMATGTLSYPAEGAYSGGETVVFDNVTPSTVGYIPGVTTYIMLMRSMLSAGGSNSITGLRFGYATQSLQNVTLVIRLHTGASDTGEPGTTHNFSFTGLPPSPDGMLAGWIIDVDLTGGPGQGQGFLSGDPIHVPDGYVGMSWEVFDTLTGPLMGVGAGEVLLDGLDFYGKNTDYKFTFNGMTLNADTIPYFELRGVAQSTTEGTTLGPKLTARRIADGSIETVGEVDAFRYDALKGEKATLQVKRTKGSAVLPDVTVTQPEIGTSIASVSSTGKGKVKLKLVFPSTGTYLINVAGGSDSLGRYEVRIKGKPPREARKPVPPLTPGDPTALLVFPAREGALLTTRIRADEQDAAQVGFPSVDTLDGTMELFGSLLVKVGEFVIEKLEVSALGQVSVFPGQTALGLEDVPQTAFKTKVIPASKIKVDKTRVSERDSELVGQWVRADFITDQNSSRLTLDLDKNSGLSKLVVRDGGVVTTYTIREWSVSSFPSSTLEGAGTLSYVVKGVVSVNANFPAPPAPPPFSDGFYHPDGDPNRITFVTSGDTWFRPSTSAPGVPTILTSSLTTTTEWGPAGGFATLTISCDPVVEVFEIYRAIDGGGRPDVPYDFHSAHCTGPDGGRTTWVDYMSQGADAGDYTYWVRALDAEGFRSGVSDPVNVDTSGS